MKRWRGVKLNMKPLPANCAMQVGYRTSRDVGFTGSGYTLTNANQNKPVLLPIAPRSREIQFKFTFFTSTVSTPELLSYDVLYDIINSVRQ
jgi:hypothetical protein